MKAEELEIQLKEFYTTNKESKGSGFGKRLIDLYARIQIEKDRKALMDRLYLDQNDKTIWESFKQTPINLD